jgi:uncharacterized membrane protein
MITIFILLGTFLLSILIQKIFFKRINLSLSGRIAMSAMLLFTASGHFLYKEGMAMMLPGFIPFKEAIVLFTGVLEILAAITLLIPRWQKLTSILLIIFFIVLLPANIHAALNHVNFQTASFDGKGPGYLWLRVPLQLVFISWVWYFGYITTDDSPKPVAKAQM